MERIDERQCGLVSDGEVKGVIFNSKRRGRWEAFTPARTAWRRRVAV
jgi:hypothetical protein